MSYNNTIPRTLLVLGAATLSISGAKPFAVRTTYGHNRQYLESISQVSGSNISVKYQTRNNQLQSIKDAFALTDELLAEVVGVSRKTLHNWEKQGIKKEKDRQRIFELSVIAEDWRYNQLPTQSEKLKEKVLGNDSILTLLKSTHLDREKILFAGRRLAHQSLAAEQGLF